MPITRAYGQASQPGNAFLAGKNKIINADFGIWQRATSATFTNSAVYVAADRWWNYGTGTCTVSRQTADTTGQTYGLRFGRNSGQTSVATQIYAGQVLESATSKPFANQTITLSFYAKRGADAPSTLTAQVYSGTSTDQTAAALFGGWTGGTSVINTNFTITTTMTRYTVTATVPSTSNQLAVFFNYAPTGTAGANEWFQIEGVQLEAGSVATAFQTATGTLAGELSACMRYYQRIVDGSDTYGASYATFQATSSTAARGPIYFFTPMRTAPTISVSQASHFVLLNSAGSPQGVASVSYSLASKNQARVDLTVASGLTAGNATVLEAQSASATLNASAEL